MGAITRHIIRQQLKSELGTSDINNEYHNRYGYKPNKTKKELKLLEKIRLRLAKLERKKSKLKKEGGND